MLQHLSSPPLALRCWGKRVVVATGVVEGSIGWRKERVLPVHTRRKRFCEAYLMSLARAPGYPGKRPIRDS